MIGIGQLIFLILIFSLSFQLGLHFWPPFSYVYGIRIDYLSPTLYLLDILIGFLFLSFLFEKKRPKLALNDPLLRILIPLFLLSLLWNFFYAKSIEAHIYGAIRILEFTFLAFYVATYFKKAWIKRFVNVIALSAVVSSVLAVLQFINQSSIGGLWYFIGERTFNTSTIGIAKFSLNGEILRSYAAFPHPNVLAFFLLTATIFILFRFNHEKKMQRIFLAVSFLFSSVALLLTFSRIIVLIYLAALIIWLFLREKKYLFFVIPVCILAAFYLLYFHSRFLNLESLIRDFSLRSDLISNSIEILSKNLYFGVGLNNFFIHQAPLVKMITPTLYQPPHNIFMLSLVSLGIFGFMLIPYVFYLAVRSLIVRIKTKDKELKDFYIGVLILLVSVIFLGMFDHFFLTLEQGQIMFALILGLSFSTLWSRGR